MAGALWGLSDVSRAGSKPGEPRGLEDHMVHTLHGARAGEDFAFFCRKVPCNFGFLGIRNETLGSVHALHNPRRVGGRAPGAVPAAGLLAGAESRALQNLLCSVRAGSC